MSQESIYCEFCDFNCGERPQLAKKDQGEPWTSDMAKKYGWYSRRHKTSNAKDAAREKYFSKSKRRENW